MAEVEEPLAPPKPKTELEAIQMQANQMTDESLESTRRMMALCEEVNKLTILSQFSNNFYILFLFSDCRAKKPEFAPWLR